MTEPTRVRVLLLSPERRLLLFKYRHTHQGVDYPIWATCGGGAEPGETIEQTAARELFEETGMTDVRLGPTVWYGEDGHRGRRWGRVYREHFILAEAPHETLDTSGWMEGEKQEILETRWWTLDEIRASDEDIYPFGLADLLEPLLRGEYPPVMLVLPPLYPHDVRHSGVRRS